VRAGNPEHELQPVRCQAGDRRGEKHRETHPQEATVPGRETGGREREADRRRGETVRQQVEDLEEMPDESGSDDRAGEPDEIDSHSDQRVNAVARAAFRRGR